MSGVSVVDFEAPDFDRTLYLWAATDTAPKSRCVACEHEVRSHRPSYDVGRNRPSVWCRSGFEVNQRQCGCSGLRLEMQVVEVVAARYLEIRRIQIAAEVERTLVGTAWTDALRGLTTGTK